jgi:hypothetical protein
MLRRRTASIFEPEPLEEQESGLVPSIMLLLV